MVKTQLDIPEKLDQEIKIYAIKNKIADKRDAILKICTERLL